MISAKIIAHSKSSVTGKEIITWELEYPRFIHAEFMTHRLFSRNAASSRAIPVAAVIDQVRNNPAMPIHWGKNQPGMQAKEELSSVLQKSAEFLWRRSAKFVCKVVEGLQKIGLHKQAANRLLEPYQLIKVVMTTTEDDNWFWLRNHPDAQPEIKRLAEVMLEAFANSEAIPLFPGDWHVPYYDNGTWVEGVEENNTLEEALAISASCCAQVSYRKLDDSLEKAKDIFAKLIESKPCHASPTEHQATPMKKTHAYGQSPDFHPSEKGTCNHPASVLSWEEGVTHADRKGNLWSGNFKGWIQHRQLIPDNACWNYSPDGDKE